MDGNLGAGSLFNRPSPAQLLRQSSSKRSSSRRGSGSSHGQSSQDDESKSRSSGSDRLGEGDSGQPAHVSNSSDQNKIPVPLDVDKSHSDSQSLFSAQIAIVKPPIIVKKEVSASTPQEYGRQQPSKGTRVSLQEDSADILQIGKVRPSSLTSLAQTERTKKTPSANTYASLR
jgi:hypothetical protein